jgi:hypothetical protein
VDLHSLTPGSKTGGLLLAAFQAGKTEPLEWVQVTVGHLVVTVSRDAMKAQLGDRKGVRLPVSYAEAVEICRALDCVSPTEAICNAMFEQAKVQLGCVPLVVKAGDSAKMDTVEFTLRFHDAVERQIAACGSPGGLVAGAWKHWLLHPRLGEKGAVNYGFWDKSRNPPAPVQRAGAQHDARHYDYSQLLQPVKREARTFTGQGVDLLDYLSQRDSALARHLDAYRATPAQRVSEFDP